MEYINSGINFYHGGFNGKKIVGYARCNAPEQAEDSQALERQAERLKKAGATEIFADIGSGRAENRSQLNLMMDLVRTGEVEEVVVTRIDRLARSLSQLSQFVDTFEDSGANLRILEQQLDLSTPTGKLMARMLGVVAEWETDLLAARVRHGKQYRIRKQQANES